MRPIHSAAMIMIGFAAIVLGCTTTGSVGKAKKETVKPEKEAVETIRTVLADAHQALKAGEIDRAMAAFSEHYRDSQAGDKPAVRTYLRGLASQGAFHYVSIHMEKCRITVDGSSAVAKPVVFQLPEGSVAQAYRLMKEADGVWRIVNVEEIPAPSVDVWTAASIGHMAALEQHIAVGTDLNAQDPSTGTTPLNVAALFGQSEAAGYLIENGADVNAANRDGSVPLLIAAFFGHIDTVELLLNNGADLNVRNSSGQTALESVSGSWSPELEGIYQLVGGALRMPLDLERIRATRPVIADLLRKHSR